MKKLSRMLTSIGVAAVFLSSNPASAQDGEPIINATFYSDSSFTTEVGHTEFLYCNRYGHPIYQLVGTHTYHTQNELIGYCPGGSD